MTTQCKHQDIRVVEDIPQYWRAEIVEGKALVVPDTGDLFYEGASEEQRVLCLDCLETLDIEPDWQNC